MANRRFIDFPIASTVGDNDIVLIWQDGANKQTTKATILSGLPENLDELNDVVISGLTNGQILRYDSVTGKWVNTDQGNLDLNDLNDVSIVSPSNGQVLVYNSSTSKWENSSGGFVPYVGAVTTVDLGAQGLRAGYVRFDTSVVTVPDEQGLMYWDDSRSTAALIMNGTLQHIGQDVFFYVKNSSGSSIPKGTAVRFAGTNGASGHILIEPFLANGTYPSSYFMGVTSETIANGSFGQVMHFGELTGINTSGFTAGDLLYASTTVAGGFQTTPPVAPNNIVLIAAAINSTNNGAIIVRPQIGSNINNDEGVKITSPTTGDLLQLQAGGLWENKTIDGAGIVTKATSQVISGLKTFNVNTLMMQSSGNANAVYLSNSSGSSTYQSGFNFFGFNTDNHIYFAKSSITGGNTGILAWNNTATRTYTLKDASGTIAFTSDIPANPVGGTGTTNYLPKFTGSTTIGNSQIFDNGTNVGIGTSSPLLNLQINSASGANSTLAFSENNGLKWYARYNVGDGSFSIVDVVNSATRLIINTSGNLGLGVTPSAWASGFTVLQVKNASIWSTGNDASFTANAYYDGSNYRYIGSAAATRVYHNTDGSIGWSNSPSGTAGNAISFTQAMTLTSGGNLLVGTTTDNGVRLDVVGTARFTNNANSGNQFIIRNTTAGSGSSVSVELVSDSSAAQASFGKFSSTTSAYKIVTSSNTYLYNGTAAGDIAILNDFASGAIKMAAGGSSTAQFTITSSGNVLIGTTTDNGAKLQVSGDQTINATQTYTLSLNNTAQDVRMQFQVNGTQTFQLSSSSSQVNIFGTANIPMIFYTNSTERMRITSGGNVGIGVDNPQTQLHINGVLTFTEVGFNTVRLNQILSTHSAGSSPNNSLRFLVSDGSGTTAERMRVNGSGNVLIGTTTDGGYKLDVAGKARVNNADGFFVQSGSQFRQMYFDGFSTLYFWNGSNQANLSSAGAWVNASDISIKKNIQDLNYSLSDLLNLKPKSYEMKLDNLKQIGFIAQEVEEIIPELVTTDNKGMKGLNYGNLTALLVKAIQELKQEIDTLKN